MPIAPSTPLGLWPSFGCHHNILYTLLLDPADLPAELRSIRQIPASYWPN